MADAGRAGPAHRGHAATTRGPATPSWKWLGRGGDTSPGAHGGTGGSRPSWEPSVGSWGAPGGGRGCGAGVRHRPLWPGGCGMSPWLLCKRQRLLPGNVLAGGTRASKQTDAAPAVGRRAGSRFRSALSHPGTVEQGGSAVCRAPGTGGHPPSLGEGSTARLPPKPALLGAEELLTSCQGTARPSGCPSLCQGEGERAQGVCAAGAGGL